MLFVSLTPVRIALELNYFSNFMSQFLVSPSGSLKPPWVLGAMDGKSLCVHP